MLDRKLAVPGAMVEIYKQSTAIDKTLPNNLLVMEVPGRTYEKTYQSTNGDRFEILVKPKKYNNINCVKVKNMLTGADGFCYWCDFRNAGRYV
jgi:hypothetical protein